MYVAKECQGDNGFAVCGQSVENLINLRKEEKAYMTSKLISTISSCGNH